MKYSRFVTEPREPCGGYWDGQPMLTEFEEPAYMTEEQWAEWARQMAGMQEIDPVEDPDSIELDPADTLVVERMVRKVGLPAHELIGKTAALRAIEKRYPRADLDDIDALIAKLPIDHGVARVPDISGGHTAARNRLDNFLKHGLAAYPEGRNHPDQHAASGLSPWLHFGHIGAQVELIAFADRVTAARHRRAVDPQAAFFDPGLEP